MRTRKSEEASIREPESNIENRHETERRIETASLVNILIKRKGGSLWREETKKRGKEGKEYTTDKNQKWKGNMESFKSRKNTNKFRAERE
jgi:2,3-bisphosphoglycerate-independent phosphoglycerate mutase